MSEVEITKFNKDLSHLVPWIKVLVVMSFGFGGWVGSLEWRAQSMSRASERLDSVERWREVTDATKFTSSEASKVVAAFTDSMNTIDKRVTRNEDAVTGVKGALDRIEKKLDSAVK